MHYQQTNYHEQKVTDKEPVKNKLVVSNLVIEHDAALFKASPGAPTARINRLHTITEIKRRDALTSIPLDNCKDLLEIRRLRQSSKPSGEANDQSSVITINVSGNRYQTHLSTLQLYPNTLLGNENNRKRYWNPKAQEYFFDRHRTCFEAILYYYQSHGRLRRPDFVPVDTFLEEIHFFELGEEASAQVHQAENIEKVKEIPMPRMLWRRYIWFFFECPQHSAVARVINLMSTVFTIVSCVSLAIETLPQYTNHWDDICKERANVSLNATYVPRCSALFESPFFIIQTVCVVFFTMEFLLRLISTPSYYRFVLSFYNWVDLSAVVPYYVFLSIELADQDIGLDTSAIFFVRILRILRFSRIFKIYLFVKRLKTLRVLTATMRESMIDFIVMVTILALLAFLFGAITFFFEQNANGDIFDSIPRATYWGIITMTGVGYGDMCPITVGGRIITCLCALCGPATMGMLISVFVDRYQRVYNRRMYTTEPEVASVNFDINNSPSEDLKSVTSSHKSCRKRDFVNDLSRQLSIRHGKIKHDQHQSSVSQAYKLQFVVSFDNKKNDKDKSTADHVVTIMKKKLAEAISTSDIDINLKLIDDDSKELWTISSSHSPAVFTSNYTLSKNADDMDQPQIHAF